MIEEVLYATLRLDLAQAGYSEDEIEEKVFEFDIGYVMNEMWYAYNMLLDDIGEKNND
jgi:hypothetical protein